MQGKNKKRMKQEKDAPKEDFRKKVAKVLELPGEVVQNVPKITMVGTGNIIIENYRGMVEVDPSRIRINTGSGLMKIIGTGLSIREITSEDLWVEGDIQGLEFIR